MKKILLAFDGGNFSKGAFEFARRINKVEPILLTGVFVPQVDYATLWSFAGSSGVPSFVPLLEPVEGERVKKNIRSFEKLCKANDIEFRVHKDFFDFAVPELKKETRFADMAILGSESFYKHIGTGEPNEFMREILHGAECPVVVVPEHTTYPKRNILAYDGTESSVYAIKQFAYLFPDLCKNPTLVVTLEAGEEGVPAAQKLRELVSQHFPAFEIINLEIDARKYFATWISEERNAILVCGAFSRSAFSQLFHKSFVSEIIRNHQLPVFVAHR